MSSPEKSLIKHAENFQGVESLEKENVGFQKDTKYSWFVCSCAFITQIFVLGTLHAFGVFFVEFIKEFKSAKGETAWIGSLAYGLSMTFGPVTSVLVSRFSNRSVMVIGGVVCATSLVTSSFAPSISVMFFTFSFLYGIGTCMCTSPTMTITPEYFDKHLAIATGITVAGSSFGTLIMGPLSQAICDKAGWRTAFRVFAGLCLVTSVLNSRIRTPPHVKYLKRRRKTEGHSFLKDLQIWKNRVFVVWTLSITLVMFGFYIPYVHLVSYAVDQGVSQDLASLLIMILGATTATGRIVFGKIVQYGVLNRLHMHQLSMVVTGAGVMVLPLLKSYPLIVLYVVVVGLVDGCYVVLLPLLTAHLVGLENSVLAWGFMIGSCSVTFTLGPPAAGALYDMTGNYDVAFHCAGLPILIGAALLFLIPWAQRTARSRNQLSLMSDTTCITIQAETSQDSGARRSGSVDTLTGDQQPPATAFRLTCRSSDVSVRTTGTGTSPNVSSYTGTDKATSTEDIVTSLGYPPEVAEIMSYMSFNSQAFEEMLRRSLDPGSTMSATMATSVTSQQIPRLPPPSQPLRYRRREHSVESRGSHDSAGTESVDTGTGSALESAQFNPPPRSHVPSAPVKPMKETASYSVKSAGNIDKLPLADNQTMPSSLPVPIKPSAGLAPGSDISEPTMSTSLTAPGHNLSPRVRSIVDKDARAEAQTFDEAISEQVSLVRDELVSPSSASENAAPLVSDDDTARREALEFSRLSSVSPAIDIVRPSPSTDDMDSPQRRPSSKSDISPPANTASYLASQIAEIEAMKLATAGSSVSTSSSNNREASSTSKTGFEQENQLTVVSAKHPTPPTTTKLVDLFRPIAEDDDAERVTSYELVDVSSGNDVMPTRSHTGVIDIFKHLFDDDEHHDENDQECQ